MGKKGKFDYKQYAREKLKEYYESGRVRNLTVGICTGSYEKERISTLGYIQVCEREIRDEKTFNQWMTRVQIQPEFVRYYTDSSMREVRPLGEVIEDVLNSDFKVGLCVEKLAESKDHYLIRVLDDLFLLPKVVLPPIRRRYDWLAETLVSWNDVLDLSILEPVEDPKQLKAFAVELL